MSSASPHQHPILSRDLRSDDPALLGEPTVEQLALPGIEPPPARRRHRQPRTTPERPSVPPADDLLLTAFGRRLAAQGRARQGQLAYGKQMRSSLLIAGQMTGRAITSDDLF